MKTISLHSQECMAKAQIECVVDAISDGLVSLAVAHQSLLEARTEAVAADVRGGHGGQLGQAGGSV